MHGGAFEMMAAAERDHWWFRGRREFITAAFRRASLPSGARVLDAGCGFGGNLAVLREFGAVWAFERDARARAAATATGIAADVAFGALPDEIPFSGTTFDAIGLFDVLEQVEAPVAALRALADRLSADGAMVLTVPAHPTLWGPHDEYHHHFHRFTTTTLRRSLEAAGLRVEYLSHFNTLLLPLALAQRVRERFFGYEPGDLMPGSRLDQALFRIWTAELRWIPRRTLPVGLSILAIARRSSSHAVPSRARDDRPGDLEEPTSVRAAADPPLDLPSVNRASRA